MLDLARERLDQPIQVVVPLRQDERRASFRTACRTSSQMNRLRRSSSASSL